MVRAHESAKADGTSEILVPTVKVRMKEADKYLYKINKLLSPGRRLFQGFFMDDIYYIKKTLSLARKGIGFVSPNPMVGALLVKENSILAEGYHKRYGGPHAEVSALLKITDRQTEGATLYVNLEPCSHQGKTPPCVDRIISTKIYRVVIGTKDPNPIVNGKGIKKLKENGIDVRVGLLENECRRLNETYFKSIISKKPFVTLKIAQTLDGKIATLSGQSRWITNDASRKLVHKMRAENDCIMVGIDTIITDNPQLTVRDSKGRNPKRVILDSCLRIPLDACVLQHPDPMNTIVVASAQIESTKIDILRKNGIQVWLQEVNKQNSIDLPKLLKKCGKNGIHSVLVEGGNRVFTSFLNSKEADRLVMFIAPKVFGSALDIFGDLGVTSPDGALQFQDVVWHKIGCDMMFEGRLHNVHWNH